MIHVEIKADVAVTESLFAYANRLFHFVQFDFFLFSSDFLFVLSESNVCYYIVYQSLIYDAKIMIRGTKMGRWLYALEITFLFFHP